MGEVIKINPETAKRLKELTLEQLFDEAAKYGAIGVYSSLDEKHPNRYRVKLVFDSIPGTSVEAASEFGLQIHDAFIQAIDRAERIVEQYKQ